MEKIGEGSFGVIHRGKSDLTKKEVAIKFESKKSAAPQLRDEYRTYKLLANIEGIPTVYYFGAEGAYNVMVMQLLGPSLEELFELCGRRFSIKTVCQIAIQLISRIQSIHERGFIYRDIKPDNFLISRPLPKPADSAVTKEKTTTQNSLIWAVDFGMAKLYCDPKTNQHIPYREKKSLSGTARYMSINTHLGREQSRRDDLEALGHVFLYFSRGSLPWQGLRANTNREKYEKIGEEKQTVQIAELTHGLPPQFSQYLAYTRGLGFEELPDYEMLKSLFKQVLETGEYAITAEPSYDWDVLANDEQRKGLNGSAAFNHYESPNSTPNHLPLTQNHSHRHTNAGASNMPIPPHSRITAYNNAPANPVANNAGGTQQAEPSRRIPLWRRFFCLCTGS